MDVLTKMKRVYGKELQRMMGLRSKEGEKLMAIMDEWVKEHPWARGGWVPEDKVTSDYKGVLPNEELIVIDSPHPIQQVRREISDFAGSYYWKMIKLIHFYRKDKKEEFETKYGKQ